MPQNHVRHDDSLAQEGFLNSLPMVLKHISLKSAECPYLLGSAYANKQLWTGLRMCLEL